MMSASEGEGVLGKADVVREGAIIFEHKSVTKADKGEGVENPKILQMSFMDAPLGKCLY